MAALSDSRLVWSATLVMVVTTELMLVVFSLRTASLAVIEPDASMIWRMVVSMRVMAGVAAAGEVGGLFGDLVDLVHRLHQLLGGGGDLLGGGADLRRRGGDFVGGALLFPGRRGNLGGGGVDLNARTLDLADQFGEVVRQTIEAIAQDAEFIAPLQTPGAR